MAIQSAGRREHGMSKHNTYKLVEIVGTSGRSFADAVSNGVERASKTLRNMDWFEVSELRGRVNGGKVAEFQVKMKVGFRLDEE